MDPNELKKMSSMALSKWQAGYKRDTHNYILAENEWRRREMQEQHKLNEKIIKQQHELNLKISSSQNKIVIIAAIITGLIGFFGVFMGAYLTSKSSVIQNNQEVHRQQKILAIKETDASKALNQINPDLKTVDTQKVSSQSPIIKEKNR